MKFGAFVNILESNRHSWSEQFGFIDRLSYLDHVELWVEDVPSTSDFLYLRDAIRDVNPGSLLIHAPFVGVSLASHDENLRNASVKRVIESARLGESLGASVLTCHSGMVGAWVEQNSGLNRLAQSLSEIVAETSVAVAIENMPMRFGGARELVTTVSDLRYLVEIVKGLNVTLDVGHCVQNGESPFEAFSQIQRSIINVHIHDGVKQGSAHRPLGAGDLEAERLIGKFLECGYSGFISLETLGERDTSASWSIINDIRDKLEILKEHQALRGN